MPQRNGTLVWNALSSYSALPSTTPRPNIKGPSYVRTAPVVSSLQSTGGHDARPIGSLRLRRVECAYNWLAKMPVSE